MTAPAASWLALALAFAGPAAAQGADPPDPLGCEAAGYDVLLSNTGAETLAAGTTVAWTVDFVRRSGRFTLERDLAPGESVFVSGALGSDYLSSPASCVAAPE